VSLPPGSASASAGTPEEAGDAQGPVARGRRFLPGRRRVAAGESRGVLPGGERRPWQGSGPGARLPASPPWTHPAGLAVVVAASAVLNLVRLSQNGYANIFYSAGVQSMLRSWHNFVFVSFDPGGLISVDKPPLALWVQAASAKLFGFSPLSLLLPEAIFGVLAVGALYLILARRLGALAAFAGALGFAVFPSFVAVSRENGVDPLLILLLVLACGAGIRACERGRWGWIVLSGVLVGLAFNTKTLAAYLAVPGIAAAFMVCAPGSIVRRALQLLVAGLAMAAVSFSWIALVEATPASERPYVGSSTNNTEIGLAFEYNGVGRVGGQAGGPNTTVVRPGGRVPAKHKLPPKPKPTHTLSRSSTLSGGGLVNGRNRYPIPFGGSPGPLRLFGVGLGDQAAWLLPFALFGLIAAALLVLLGGRRRDAQGDGGQEPAVAGRRDPRLAALIVLGGWFLVEAIVLSTSKGIVHPYYVSALAPGTGAMAGVGVFALVQLARGSHRLLGLALAAAAVTATIGAEVVLAHREHYLLWFVPVLVIGAIVLLGALVALRALALPAIALLFALLLVLPAGYASTTWLAPVEGTFPAAGPRQAAGAPDGFGVNSRDLGIDRALAAYVSSHRPGTRWALLTVASDTAAPMMLEGLKAGALGGYSGTDPALDGPGLARYVQRGEARWILLGGEYSLRGGNLATRAVLRACRQIDPSVWHSPVGYPFGLTLFDCAGRERRLAA
jgi:4-amino-4-deoxy-L-arabinose transferase-like glycosyltransferase